MATVELVAYTEIDELAEAIRRDGFAYMPGVLNGEEISTLREQIERIEPNPRANDRAGITKRAVGLQSEEVAEFRESHTKVLFNRDAYFLQFLDRAPVAGDPGIHWREGEGAGGGEGDHAVYLGARKVGIHNQNRNLILINASSCGKDQFVFYFGIDRFI